jgi:single-stranded-DNA-specific exonuclease
LNRERRDVESAALSLIDARLQSDLELAADRLLVVDGEGWHRGVIGILASRVVERTAKPALVISVEAGPSDAIAHGSGRSVDGFPLLAAIESCADLFTRFGGHAFAVGFSLPAASLPELKKRLRLYADQHLAARAAERILNIDAVLPLDRITPILAGALRKLEPLGHGNPEPVFLARDARLIAPPRILKERHLCLELTHPSPNGSPDHLPARSPAASIRAIGWNLASLAADLNLAQGSLVNIAYRIRENDHPDFGGLEIEILGIQRTEALTRSIPPAHPPETPTTF